MGAIDTSYTFTATDVITSTKMNNILDQSTITATAVFNNTLEVASGKLLVKAGGITSNELGAGAVTANSILNSSVTPEKLSNGGPSWTIGGTLSAAMFSGPITGNLTGNSSGTHTGTVIGNVTGNVTGNITGNITGNSNGTHTGPVIGNVTGDLTGSVTGNTSGSSGSCTGNSATATTWQTPRNLALTGDVTATLLNVNGSAAISAVATISDNAVTTAKILNGNVTTLKILDGAVTASKLAAGAAIPAGAVMPFAMNSVPSGWLGADGTAVSRSTYAALFAEISTLYGVGDGSTTFNLPDLRGYFVRGSGTNVDGTVSGTFAAKQADELKSHTHTMYIQGTFTGSSTNVARFSDIGTGSSTTQATGGTETRPKNIAMLYCIKH